MNRWVAAGRLALLCGRAFPETPAQVAIRATQGLTAILPRQSPAGIAVLVTPIRSDDADCLTARELSTLASHAPARRAASGAARRAARLLCAQAGMDSPDVLRSPRGRPVWPPGLVGSLSHDPQFAAAAIGRDCCLTGIGIDVEPAVALPPHVRGFIAAPAEGRQFGGHPFADKALFSIKEAVFKSVSRDDAPPLEFSDVTVDLPTGTATVSGRGIVRWCLITDPLVVAVAWQSAPGVVTFG